MCWYEVCELAPSGEYLPVSVEHAPVPEGFPRGAQPMESVFLLQQGVQRRVVMTIVHESGADLAWGKVSELSMGVVLLFLLFAIVVLSALWQARFALQRNAMATKTSPSPRLLF